MTEVEKLYSLAGVEDELFYDQQTKTWSRGYFFEPEKQIAITELLGNYNAFYDKDNEYFSFITNHKDKNGIVRGFKGVGKNTCEAVASLICNLWQDLTEAEQNEIREILSE